MSAFEALNSLILPGRRKGESVEEKLAHDAVDRFILGSARVKLVDDASNVALRGVHDAFSDEDELSEEKTKLEIEMMKRKLGMYRDDDKYQKEMNRDGPLHPLLVAHNARRYAERGKSLIEHIIGDGKHGSGLIQRFLR